MRSPFHLERFPPASAHVHHPQQRFPLFPIEDNLVHIGNEHVDGFWSNKLKLQISSHYGI